MVFQNNKTSNDELLIYPNPATTYLNVVFDDPSYIPARYRIYDFSGKMIIDKNNEGAWRVSDIINGLGIPGAISEVAIV